MESSFKGSIKRTDMKFYGQGRPGQELDRYLYENLFKRHRGGFFVECGAFDGHLESTCRFFEESLDWTGVNIEPVPHAFNKLLVNRPNCLNLRYAISSSNHKSKFKNAIHPKMGRRFGNGSLKHVTSHMKDLQNQGCTFEEFEVTCKKFSNLATDHGIIDIDLFVLDVEGHELEALRGIVPEILPKVFCIEHTHVGLENIKTILGKNYGLHSIHKHNAIFVQR